MDAGNLLKPALARGQLRCIGATTLDEYREYIEKDAALERRFQQVYVDQPTVEATTAILRGLKERYELHHGVSISDGALVAAAMLSDRYITDRFLPDKAIDLVDEAAAKLRIDATIVEAGGDPTKEEEVRLKVLDQLRGTYRPEFLNRLDEVVIFNPLRKADLRAIARLTLTALTQRLTLKDISLEVSDRALDVLTDLGYSPEYGARPLKRVVQKELETPIARGIISGAFNEGDTVMVDADLDAIRLVIEKRSGGGGEEKGPSAPMAGDLAPAA